MSWGRGVEPLPIWAHMLFSWFVAPRFVPVSPSARMSIGKGERGNGDLRCYGSFQGASEESLVNTCVVVPTRRESGIFVPSNLAPPSCEASYSLAKQSRMSCGR